VIASFEVISEIIAAVLALAAVAYLVTALLKPERF
jgi:K+-transporting ATPase KdpF subunit